MKKKEDCRNTKIIRMYGYEYYLVEVHREFPTNMPQPCFIDYQDWALAKCVKITKERLQ